jgi:uncharacterized protein YuzE
VLTYDPRYNIVYIRLREKSAEVETLCISDELNFDLAPDGAIYGIKLWNANAQLQGMKARSFGTACNVTVVIDNFDDNDLTAILQAQRQIMREFKEFEFSLDVIYQHGRPVSELIASIARSSRTIGNASAPKPCRGPPWRVKSNTRRPKRCCSKATGECSREKCVWESRNGTGWISLTTGLSGCIRRGASRLRHPVDGAATFLLAPCSVLFRSVISREGNMPKLIHAVVLLLAVQAAHAVTFNSPWVLPSSGAAFAVGDFNGDGQPDVAIANLNPSGTPSTVTIWLRQKGATLQLAGAYAVGPNPAAVAAADFNGDGKLDLAVVNSGPNNAGANAVSILLGNGDGTFQPQMLFPVGSYPISEAVADFNGDGFLDLAVSNLDSGTVSILLGNGDGTFQPAANYPAGGAGPVAAGDFNGDGKPDLAVGVDSSLVILLNNGNAVFHAGFHADLGPYVDGIAVADFNGDGKLDLAATVYHSNKVAVLLGNGDGTFQTPVDYSVGMQPNSIAVADMNGDGFADLVVADYRRPGSILLGKGDGTFQPSTTLPMPQQCLQVTTAAFQHQGIQDVVALGAGVVWIVFNNGHAAFQAPQHFDVAGAPSVPAVGDFNGDGNPDLAIAGAAEVSILLGDGHGGFQPAVDYPAGTQPYAVAVGDFNHDGKQDLALPDHCTGSLLIFLGNGDGTFQPAVSYPVGGVYPSALAVADFNHDGNLDVAVTNSASYTVSVLLGKGDGTFLPPATFAAGTSPDGIAVGDFNNDGNPDLAVADFGTGTSAGLSILLGNGKGGFTSGATYNFGIYAGGVVTADFNGDGHLDLAVETEAALSILLGNGDGTFQPPVDYIAGAGYTLALGDFNGDGTLDLATGADYFSSVLLGHGDGTFQAPVSFAASGGRVAVADFNRDGKPDLAVSTNNGSASVAILLNTTAGSRSGNYLPVGQ